jgi:hypothetical protein
LTLLKILGRNVPLIKARIYFKFMIASAEELPFDDGGHRSSYLFPCTIPDAKGIRRNEKSIETNRTSFVL